MNQEAVDITPVNGSKFLWAKQGTNVEEFEAEYSLKKIKVRGIFDHLREIQVEKTRNGEKGVDVVTPFYTHLNEKGEECGIIVNRGWLPEDLKDLKLHYSGVSSGEITGLLYRGDAKTKYS